VARFRSRTGRVASAGFNRRKTRWVGSSSPDGTTSLAANTISFDQQFTAGEEPETLVRTRGLLLVQSDQVAAREEAMGALGMAVVRVTAAAIGVTAIPAPIDEISDDVWYLWEPWVCAQNAAGTTAGIWKFPFDSKAQRKLVDGDAMVAVVQNADDAFGVEYELVFRQLLMLS